MVTLSKIAKLAHVSVSTVSKAFSMSNEVNEQTRNEIFKVANELGCFKKYYNAKYPKLVIGVICPEFASLYYAEHLTNIEARLEHYNCDICVASTNFSREKEEEILRYYNLYTDVDGVIVLDSLGKRSDDNDDIPIVRMGLDMEDVDLTSDISSGIDDAIKYLTDMGIKRIGYIGEMHTSKKCNIVMNTVAKYLGEFDKKFMSVCEERFEKGGYLAMQNMFEKGNLPEAVICAYDYMAIGAMKCISDHGLQIPGDIAVIGMDNISEAEFLTPALSSIDLRSKDLCFLAVDRIIDMITKKEDIQRQVIPSYFIPRDSSKIK